MKKSKLIITAIIVIAVVGSAAAFKPQKGGMWCASTTQNSGCAILSNRICDAGPFTHFYYEGWNGTSADCLTNRCATAIRLVAE